MKLSFEAVLFFVIFLDATICTIVAWLWIGKLYYLKNFPVMQRYFPLTRGWATYYLVLVIWVGYALVRVGIFS